MTFLFQSLTLLLWTALAGSVCFGIAGVFVARALQKSLIIGWFAGMLLGPLGIGILGLVTALSNRRMRRMSEAI
jgi:hypothetical protein